MKIKTIAVTYGGKLNLGNYESAEITCHMEAEVEPGDNPAGVEAVLWQRVIQSVREQARPLVKGRAEGVNAVFIGLPADLREELG